MANLTPIVRELLTVAFTASEFEIFCADHFRLVYRQFVSGMSQPDRIQKLLDYVTTRNLWALLLGQVRAANPSRYAEFALRLECADDGDTMATEIAATTPHPSANQEAAPMALRREILSLFRRLKAHQLDDLIFMMGIPVHQRPPNALPIKERESYVLSWAEEEPHGLQNLVEELRKAVGTNEEPPVPVEPPTGRLDHSEVFLENQSATAPPKQSPTQPAQPRINTACQSGFLHGYALVIGISTYPNAGSLPKAVTNDAQAFALNLLSPQYCGYPADQVQLLADHEATRQAISDGLQWLADRTGSKDTAIFFFSGHGCRQSDSVGEKHFLLPYEAATHQLQETAINDEELTDWFGRIPAGRLLVILDACHSGGAVHIKRSPGPGQFLLKSGWSSQFYERLSQGKGRVVMASSSADEVSHVENSASNSLFTRVLLDGLKGQAHTSGDGLIRVFELFKYLAENVPAAARKLNVSQSPLFKASTHDDFPIALACGGLPIRAQS